MPPGVGDLAVHRRTAAVLRAALTAVFRCVVVGEHPRMATGLEIPQPPAPDQPMPGPATPPDAPTTPPPSPPPAPEPEPGVPEPSPPEQPEPGRPDVPETDPKGPETPEEPPKPEPQIPAPWGPRGPQPPRRRLTGPIGRPPFRPMRDEVRAATRSAGATSSPTAWFQAEEVRLPSGSPVLSPPG